MSEQRKKAETIIEEEQSPLQTEDTTISTEEDTLMEKTPELSSTSDTEPNDEPENQPKKSVNPIIRFFVAIVSAILALVSSASKLIVVVADAIIPPRARELMPLIAVTRTMFVAISEALAGTEAKDIIEAEKKLQELASKKEEVAQGYAIRKAIGQTIDYGLSGAMLALYPVLTYLRDLTHLDMWIIVLLASSLTMILATIAMFFGPVYGLFLESRKFMVGHGAYAGGYFYKMLENAAGIPFLASKSGFTVLDTPPVDAETLEDFKAEMGEQANEIKNRVMNLVGASSTQVPDRTKQLLLDMLSKTEQDLGDIDFRTIREDVARDFALGFYEVEKATFPRKTNESLKIFAEMNGLTLKEAKNALKDINKMVDDGKLDPDFLNSILTTGALRGLISREQEYSEIMGDLELNQVSLSMALGGRQYIKDQFAPTPFFKRIAANITHLFLFIVALPYALLKSLVGWFSYMGRSFKKELRDHPFKRSGQFIKTRYKEINGTLLFILSGQKKTDIDFKRFKPNRQLPKKILKILLEIIFILPYAAYRLIALIYGRISRLWKESEELKKNRFQQEAAKYALAYMMDEAYRHCILEYNPDYGNSF